MVSLSLLTSCVKGGHASSNQSGQIGPPHVTKDALHQQPPTPSSSSKMLFARWGSSKQEDKVGSMSSSRSEAQMVTNSPLNTSREATMMLRLVSKSMLDNRPFMNEHQATGVVASAISMEQYGLQPEGGSPWDFCLPCTPPRSFLQPLGHDTVAEWKAQLTSDPTLMVAMRSVIATCASMVLGFDNCCRHATKKVSVEHLVHTGEGSKLLLFSPCFETQPNGQLLPGIKLQLAASESGATRCSQVLFASTFKIDAAPSTGPATDHGTALVTASLAAPATASAIAPVAAPATAPVAAPATVSAIAPVGAPATASVAAPPHTAPVSALAPAPATGYTAATATASTTATISSCWPLTSSSVGPDVLSYLAGPSLVPLDDALWQSAINALPSALTLLDMDTGSVIMQNQASEDFYGGVSADHSTLMSLLQACESSGGGTDFKHAFIPSGDHTMFQSSQSAGAGREFKASFNPSGDLAPFSAFLSARCGKGNRPAFNPWGNHKLLKKLFRLQPALLAEAMANVVKGDRWSKAMKVTVHTPREPDCSGKPLCVEPVGCSVWHSNPDAKAMCMSPPKGACPHPRQLLAATSSQQGSNAASAFLSGSNLMRHLSTKVQSVLDRKGSEDATVRHESLEQQQWSSHESSKVVDESHSGPCTYSLEEETASWSRTHSTAGERAGFSYLRRPLDETQSLLCSRSPMSANARMLLRTLPSRAGLAQHCEVGLQNVHTHEEEEQAKGEAEEVGGQQQEVWHEVLLLPLASRCSSHRLLLIMHGDVSARVQEEKQLASLTNILFGMVGSMFPRHVLEHIVEQEDKGSSAESTSAAGQRLSPGFRTDAFSESSLSSLARSHKDVSIMFMDIIGFTTMSKDLPPQQVMKYLNSLFSVFDSLVDKYHVYKVETAGDCYIVAGGMTHIDKEGLTSLDDEVDPRDGARRVVAFAWALIEAAESVRMPHDNSPTRVRVGIHTGDVTSGVIGTKLPKFSIFGDTMNTASRMESTCHPQHVQVSKPTYKLITEVGGVGVSSHTPTGQPLITEALLRERPDEYLPLLMQSVFQPREPIEVKGKGMMETFLCNPADLALLHPDLNLTSPAVIELLDSVNRGTGKPLQHIGSSLSIAEMLFSSKHSLTPPSLLSGGARTGDSTCRMMEGAQ